MKFTITREQLSEGVSAVSAAVPSKTTLPVLANILLEATKDGLRLSGTDLDIAVSTTVPASVDQEGAITLPARKLQELVRELPSAGIRFTTQGEQRVTIECGRSKFKLLGLPREEFPAFPQVTFDGASRTTARDLQKLVAHVAFAASTEESRPILNGVLWQLTADRMRMVATNGHRLAKMEVPLQGGTAQPAELIVPPKALEQFRKLFGADDEIEIGRSDNHLGFKLGDDPGLHPTDRGAVPELRAGHPARERQVRDRGEGHPDRRAPPHEHRRLGPDPPDPDVVRRRLLPPLGDHAGPRRGAGGDHRLLRG